ncbi:MAG: hypothetical protein GY847_40315 [Proteobacteria bacterium]|nr:hypothetical protein [Pseudomonadota bacterium]
MPETSFQIDEELIRQLKLWIDCLAMISFKEERCRCELADLGVISYEAPPDIESYDRPAVIRLKEKLLILYRERLSTFEEMAAADAELLDEQTLEIVLTGGPQPGSCLSWLPGEPCIGWWRESKDTHVPRRLLPGIDLESAKPMLH